MAQKWGVGRNTALQRALDIAEGQDILAILAVLKERYHQGVTPDELALLEVLYSWLAYVFDYR